VKIRSSGVLVTIVGCPKVFPPSSEDATARAERDLPSSPRVSTEAPA
jgi:hypothetical protein